MSRSGQPNEMEVHHAIRNGGARATMDRDMHIAIEGLRDLQRQALREAAAHEQQAQACRQKAEAYGRAILVLQQQPSGGDEPSGPRTPHTASALTPSAAIEQVMQDPDLASKDLILQRAAELCEMSREVLDHVFEAKVAAGEIDTIHGFYALPSRTRQTTGARA